jgi:hypothetical protein
MIEAFGHCTSRKQNVQGRKEKRPNERAKQTNERALSHSAPLAISRPKAGIFPAYRLEMSLFEETVSRTLMPGIKVNRSKSFQLIIGRLVMRNGQTRMKSIICMKQPVRYQRKFGYSLVKLNRAFKRGDISRR